MIGFYCINKPTGMGSTKVVSSVKKFTKQKCGHLGTLDPAASGVLPVAVGKATKLFDYFLSKDKEYFAIGKFGVETDTLDAEGKVVSTNNRIIKKMQIEQVLKQFLGEIYQIPPNYSSIKVDGKASYKLAREGKSVEHKSRKIQVFSISCEQIEQNLFAFVVHCSAGTYIRTLISDIAKAVGSVATTVCIIRTKSGSFDISQSVTIDELENGNCKLLSIKDVVDLPQIDIDTNNCQRLLNGQTIKYVADDGDYLCYSNANLLGIVCTKNNLLKIKINLWENTND